MSDPSLVNQVIFEVKPDWVFSSAAYGAYSSETDVAQMMRTNITGLQNLLEASAATGCGAFVNVASCFEYGETPAPPSETDRCAPSTEYGFSRLAGTILSMDLARRTGLLVTTLRLYSTYGPFEDPRRLITRLCRGALRREWPEKTSTAAAHDYTYIDDVVEALLMAVDRPRKRLIYNVGSGAGATLPEFIAVSW